MEMYVLVGDLFTPDWRRVLSELGIRLREVGHVSNIPIDMRDFKRPLILDLSHQSLGFAAGWEKTLTVIGVPLIALFRADRDCMQKLQALIAFAQPSTVVYEGVNDSLEDLREHIRRARKDEISKALRERLRVSDATLFPPVSAAFGRLLSDPTEFTSVSCLAQAAGMSRRSFDRYAASVASIRAC